MKITGFWSNLLISVKIPNFLQFSKESLPPFDVLVRNIAKNQIFSQFTLTDWVQSYWKFTDFNEFTDFTGKYQVSLLNPVPFSVSLRKLIKSKRYLARLQKTCLQAEN